MNPALLNDDRLNSARESGVDFVLPANTNLDNFRKGGVDVLPVWLKQEIPDGLTLERARILSESGVHTVCQEARCPNLSYCFRHLQFTFIILGDVCSRKCRFCAVKKSRRENLNLDLEESSRIAKVVEKLGLDYVVITSVTRDDLDDGGARIFAQTIGLIHKINRNIKIEVLIPDFQGWTFSLKCVLDAGPCVVGHNIETVKRLYRILRPEATYELSLSILKKIKELRPQVFTKSSLMLGLGETEAEVMQVLRDLRRNQCDVLTLGQYLAPSPNHYPIKKFIAPEQFQRYRDLGLILGFKSVLSGPVVRSSYKAAEVYQKVTHCFSS